MSPRRRLRERWSSSLGYGLRVNRSHSVCSCVGEKRVRVARDDDVEPVDEQPNRCEPPPPPPELPKRPAPGPAVSAQPLVPQTEAGAQSLSLGAWYSLDDRHESSSHSQSELASQSPSPSPSRSQLGAELQLRLAVRATCGPPPVPLSPSGSIFISPVHPIQLHIA